jgi:hypothetical protein
MVEEGILVSASLKDLRFACEKCCLHSNHDDVMWGPEQRSRRGGGLHATPPSSPRTPPHTPSRLASSALRRSETDFADDAIRRRQTCCQRVSAHAHFFTHKSIFGTKQQSKGRKYIEFFHHLNRSSAHMEPSFLATLLDRAAGGGGSMILEEVWLPS